MRLIRYNEIGEDVKAMITAADVSGPVVLCDSSVLLMMHILHMRVTEVPGASLTASNDVIRWFFARWDPCMKIPSSSEKYTNNSYSG